MSYDKYNFLRSRRFLDASWGRGKHQKNSSKGCHNQTENSCQNTSYLDDDDDVEQWKMSSCLLSRLSQSAGGGDELYSAMKWSGNII